ncbi:hypothetical protein ACFSX5_01090 [Devosia albogilva]|uniref:Fibronectin type-III domain-containing protein n=1 Tax=Devosia albogilva TaxID=429726 RepID=A0ABW5QFW3_9HYPH
MPTGLEAILLPYIIQAMGAIGIPLATIAASATLVAAAASYLLLAGAAYLVSAAFAPPKPEAPKPEDGKYNLKQSVPPLVYVLGRVKKAGDYALLEERDGVAHHVMVTAAHHIKGFVQHYLHDEAVTLSGSGVVSPSHFVVEGDPKVRIETRNGDSLGAVYAPVKAAFPEIWGDHHRGDGLASVYMRAFSVPAEDLQKVFPSGMPQHLAEIEGHDRLVDPRTGVPGYSTNLAVFRYWHLTHPVGGRLTAADLHTADWAHAANVCDEAVSNRSGGVEPRYHGGLWFRANNDPVQIGRLMDQAAEMVLYERADGNVGVHAGEFVEPDVRLTANDLLSVSYDPNKRRSSNVLAVRGRYTDPAKGYNTADAAIYGIPYPSEDERTKTVENQAVQRHNHIARLQKLAFIRANAPRVKIVAHFEPAREVPYRRFVRVHYPPKMTEAIVEITGRPTLSLRSLTYEFEGIVVPPTLYAFSAATEEGEPGANVLPIVRQDVPVPTDFTVQIDNEEVGSGASAAFALASFDFQNATFQYELEWQPTAGGAVQQTIGAAGATEVRSGFLADGVEYRFRARTWSSGTSSDWTAYQVLTATADPNAPNAVTGVGAVGGAGQVTFTWTAPNSANYVGARLYLNGANDFGSATLAGVEYGAPNVADSRTINGLSAGTAYGWVVAINASGVEAAPIATGSLTIT